jgi:predicted SAM-dependent methyltransferase
VVCGDILKGLPVADGSCQGIYRSHVLKHLALDEVGTTLRNAFRHLKPGGTFRTVLPDLERLARDYVTANNGTRHISS